MTIGFVVVEEVVGELAPLPVVDPEWVLGVRAYDPAQLYFRDLEVPVPLGPHWVCAIAWNALEREHAGSGGELAAYRDLRQALTERNADWVESLLKERWRRSWTAAYNAAFQRWSQ